MKEEEEPGRERQKEKTDRERAYLLACRQQFSFRTEAECSVLEGKCVPLQGV